jgi:endoglucanase
MRRGINLGNILQRDDGRWMLQVSARDLDRIAAAGFSSVRVPVEWSLFARPKPPYTVDPRFFRRVDRVVNTALRRKLVVVVEFNNYPEMSTRPRAHTERFLSIWDQVARHYRSHPPELLFEVLNEPNSALDAGLWNTLVRRALRVIRESNPDRNVVVGGVDWYAWDSLQALVLPHDDHLIATFHYYSPFEFTHQGAEWIAGADAWLGTDWSGTSAEQAEVRRHFDAVADWAADENVPVFLGEFGAYSKAPQLARARWTGFVREEAESRDFAWAYWEYAAGFGAYDREQRRWNAGLLEVLIPR